MNNNLSYRVERIEPILSVRDMNASRAFYIDILGFTEADWGNDEFTSISRGDGASIYLCKGAQGNPGTWVWIGFDRNIYELHQQLIQQGVTVRRAPVNYSWALEMQIEDPDGHVLRFGMEPDFSKPFADQEA